jgi:Na+/melibiose symporter-like transporter
MFLTIIAAILVFMSPLFLCEIIDGEDEERGKGAGCIVTCIIALIITFVLAETVGL